VLQQHAYVRAAPGEDTIAHPLCGLASAMDAQSCGAARTGHDTEVNAFLNLTLKHNPDTRRKLDDSPVDEELRSCIRRFCEELMSALNKYYAFGSCFVDDST